MPPLATFVCALACLAPLSAQNLQAEDVFQLEHVRDPQVSPDGERVVYLRSSMDIWTDRAVSRMWMIPFAGGEARPLLESEASQSSPRWSPDGSKIAYLTSTPGKGSQIHILWWKDGRHTRLTQLKHSPGSLSWSPDGRWLAFTMLVPKKPAELAHMPKKPKGAKWAEPPKVIEELHYRADGRGYLEAGRNQVFVLPADGGTPRQLTDDGFDYRGPLAWMPDSQSLILSANRREDFELEPSDTEIWRLSVKDGSLTPLTKRYGPDQAPAVSPDGKWIAYTGFDDRRQGYTVTQLYVMRSDGSELRSLTPELDRDVQSPTWNGDSSALYFSYDDHGDTHLSLQPLHEPRRLLEKHLGGLSLGRPYSGSSFSVSRNDRYAYTLGSTGHPADLAVGDRKRRPQKTGAGGQNSRRLTTLNEDLFSQRDLAKVEEFWVPSSFDQRPIQAWLVKPADFDPEQKYPLLLEIHGGPFANYGSRFSMEDQLYAAAGYLVLYANPRGSTSYGEEFGNLIHHAYPSQDYDDLMSCVDAVLERGIVDPKQLYVTGGSGGGVLTAWIVGKTDRFRAAVVAKPVINWASFVLTADAYPYFVRNWFDKMPWQDPLAYWRRSPLSLVGNVSTPTMLLTGEADFRTPISESEQFYQALKLRQIPTAMVRIPGASHGITTRPSRLAAKVAYILGWFERWQD
jgi:dipeptidyl aminopeptidase/acylaminoacyl peptidase